MGEMLTTRQVAEKLKLSERSVFTAIHSRGLRSVKIGRAVRVDEADLVAWIDASKATTTAATTPGEGQ